MADKKYFAAFNKHYLELTIALPADAMYPTFLKHNLLTDRKLDQEFKAASTNEAKTRILLDSMKGGLAIGVVIVFQQFLAAMTEFADTNGDPVVGKLVQNINKDLPSSLPPSGTYDQYDLYILSTSIYVTIFWKIIGFWRNSTFVTLKSMH